MSNSLIQDGTGKGYLAQVTQNNRIAVESVAITAEDDSIRIGEGWQISTGPVTFTGDAQSAVLFARNNGGRNFVLDRAVLILGSSTDGVGDWTFQVLRNPGYNGTLELMR